MNISEDTKNVLAFLDESGGNSLRKRDDLALILELGASSGNPDLINRIIFSGKSFWNISSKLRHAKNDTEGVDLLKKEYDRTARELYGLLIELLENAPDDIRDRFDQVYFRESQGAALNLIDLSFDLSALKELQTKMRHDQKNSDGI